MNLHQDKAEIHIQHMGVALTRGREGGEIFDQRPFLDF